MLVLVTYDIGTTTSAGTKRLHKVAKVCLNYGQRVQNSVFECIVNEEQSVYLRNELSKLIDQEKDSIRFYFLGNNYLKRVEQIGKNTSIDLNGDLIL